MDVRVDHLFRHPRHLRLVAGWIYDEFWKGKAGYSVATFERLLGQATDPDRIPLSLLALANGRPAGTVNLVHTDSEARPDLHPWLAALVVVPEDRRRGIGSALVRALLGHAARLGFPELFLGTDIPAFYARFGAERVATVRDDLCIMRIGLAGAAPGAPASGLRVYEDDLFTVDQSDACPLAGYVIVRLKGPATALGELAPDAARRLGETLARVAGAVAETVAAERVYCLAFAEIDPRLHFHLFPRTGALLAAYQDATGTAGAPVNGPALFEWARTRAAAGEGLPSGGPTVAEACALLRTRLIR